MLRAYLLVIVQFVALLAILLTGPLVAASKFLVGLEVLATCLGVWALLSMPRVSLAVLPTPTPQGRMVERGPYRWLRHPMYAALLLLAAALVIDRWTGMRGLWWLVLLIDLLLKIHYEETLLRQKYPQYQAYQQRTKRLIPFIY